MIEREEKGLKYKLEEYQIYQHFQINNIPVWVFDDHNMALPVWGTYSNKLNKRLNLVTFDFHTDTRVPFTNAVVKNSSDIMNITPSHPVIVEILSKKHYNRNDFSIDDVLEIAKNGLRNDEHILTAEYFGYLDSYTIIADIDDSDVEYYEELDQRRDYHARYYMRSRMQDFDTGNIVEPIVLDFDLDFFIDRKSFSPEFKKIVGALAKKAEVITIAKEPKYFEECKIQEDFSITEAYQILINILNESLL